MVTDQTKREYGSGELGEQWLGVLPMAYVVYIYVHVGSAFTIIPLHPSIPFRGTYVITRVPFWALQPSNRPVGLRWGPPLQQEPLMAKGFTG